MISNTLDPRFEVERRKKGETWEIRVSKLSDKSDPIKAWTFDRWRSFLCGVKVYDRGY